VPEEDRERWNERYADDDATREPSPFLASLDGVLPRAGRALDVGGGTGRHAIWLARRGLEVTVADISDVAIAKAARAALSAGVRVETLRTDLEAGPSPPGPWDVIVDFYFLHRPLFAEFLRTLAPGGWLVVAHATRRNLERHPRPGPAHLLGDGELPSLVGGLEIASYGEAWFESGRHEARLVARKPRG